MPTYEAPKLYSAEDIATSMHALEAGKAGLLQQGVDTLLFNLAEANVADEAVISAFEAAIVSLKSKRPEDVITGTVELTIPNQEMEN